jgi:hypothetical protein
LILRIADAGHEIVDRLSFVTRQSLPQVACAIALSELRSAAAAVMVAGARI